MVKVYDFGLSYGRPWHMSASQWQHGLYRDDPVGPKEWYLGARTALTLFNLVNYICLLAYDEDLSHFLIYMTYQGLTLLTIFDLLGTGLAYWEFFRLSRDPQAEQRMTPLHKTVWAMSSMCVTAAIFISIFYWAVLFEMGENDYWNVYAHGLNSFVALCHVGLSAVPWRPHHFYLPLLVGLWYVSFSLVYYWAGGTDADGNEYIYEVLDWSDPGPTVGVVVGAFFGILFVFACLYGLAQFRLFVYERNFEKTKPRPPKPRADGGDLKDAEAGSYSSEDGGGSFKAASAVNRGYSRDGEDVRN